MLSFASKYLVHYPYYLITNQPVLPFQIEFEKNQWLSPGMLKDIQWEKLKRMLHIVFDSIPFYKRRFDENRIHPDDINTYEDLLNIPVLTKEDIINNFEDLVGPTRTEKRFLKKTSGSTGVPLRIVKDRNSMAVMDAIMYRNYEWFNIRMGEKQARYWGSPLGCKQRTAVNLKDVLLNRIRFSPFDISDKACADFLKRLYTFKPCYVYGYAQTISKFSEYVVNKGVDLSPLKLKAVIITGEMIFGGQMRTIESAFKCPVSNEYGCAEVGIIAMSCPSKGMHLMIENLFVEFITNGRHAQPGEEGEIIITELYGDLMPLIRYRIGDIGYASDALCGCGRGLPLLKGIKGRSDEFIICPDGRRVDPIIFEYILKEVPEKNGRISQFRIVQETRSQLNIEVCYAGEKPDILLESIEKKLKKVLGEGMMIDFTMTDSIPVEASGKLRCFISKIKD
jgi:phenylacetate-CoA ligase